MRRLGRLLAPVGALAFVAVACGSDGGTANGIDAGGAATGATVAVTTNILGDVVQAFAGDQVNVVTIMPVGADPHDFQASAQQANEMRQADAVIVNGAGFEQGLLDVIDGVTADGIPTFEAISAVETLEFADEHGHEDGADHEEDAGHDHDHEGEDPHFFTDPTRMAASVDAMAQFLIDNVQTIDAAALRSSADAYIAELESLDGQVESMLAPIPNERRVLITNHEVFGYFADRYGFEVVGTVIPSGSTADAASAGELADLAGLIRAEDVPAIFADTSSPTQLADTLAAEVGDVEVVELFSESLGAPDSGGATYLDMVRTNAERIAGALA